jgi:hypothetical protein
MKAPLHKSDREKANACDLHWVERERGPTTSGDREIPVSVVRNTCLGAMSAITRRAATFTAERVMRDRMAEGIRSQQRRR